MTRIQQTSEHSGLCSMCPLTIEHMHLDENYVDIMYVSNGFRSLMTPIRWTTFLENSNQPKLIGNCYLVPKKPYKKMTLTMPLKFRPCINP